MKPYACAGLLSLLTLGACDSSSEFKDCVHSVDPSTGDRQKKCPASAYDVKDVPWRDVSGIVWRGDDGVAGAVVSLAPGIGERSAPAVTAITGANGFFGPLRDIPLRYDMTTRIDRDLLVVRSLAGRYAQPALTTRAHNLSAAWVKRLDVQLDPPLPPDRTAMFFATGDTAQGAVGDLETGVSLVDREFTAQATLHVVEFDRKGDLATASAYGKVDLLASAANTQLVRVHLDPITEFREPRVTVTAPSGFTAGKVELLVAFSRSSAGRLSLVDAGVPKRLPVIPNHIYVGYRVRATAADGRATDSGEKSFDISAKETKVELDPPPVLESPGAGGSVDPTTILKATGLGVFEHLLVPDAADGRGSIRIVTAMGDTALPDHASVGAAKPTGRYSWTVRSFPKLRFSDDLAGPDAGRFENTGTSAPRSVIFPAQ